MSLALTSRKAALLAPWLRNPLWAAARAVPSLDLRFADSKSLVDATTGQNLVTFTRASGGTYVDSQGVIRNAVTNLLLRSEEFDNASWTKARCSITQNAIAAPNGSITADLLIEDTSLNTHRLLATAATVTANSTVTFSVYFKSKERSQIYLYVDEVTGAGGAFFNAFYSATGVSGGAAAGGATYTSGSVQSIGDGWYRAVITGTLAGGYTSYRCSIFPAVSGTTSYQGDGASGIYLWGAQLEQSSTVGEYIPTGATINSAPRFDHNPTTGESLGLLVEEQRTNSIRNNTMVGAVAGTPGTLPTNWPYAVAGTGITREIVGTGVDNGINYIDFRFSGTSGSTTVVSLGIDRAAALTTQSWTASLYWKLVAGSTSGVTGWQLGLIEETSANAFVAGAYYTVTTPTASLSRVSASRTLSGGATVANVLMPVLISCTNGVAIDFTLRIGMPQLEQGAFATSVIPTTGTAATRSADVASITDGVGSGSNYSSWANASEGTALVNISSSVPSSGARALTLSDGTINNQAWLRLALAGTAALEVYTAGGFVAQIGSAIAQSSRTAAAIKANDFAVSVNGGTPATDSSGAIGSYSQLNIGANFNASGSFANTTIRRLTYWPQRLGNEVLQRITQ